MYYRMASVGRSMTGDSTTSESLQSYILGIYKEYVEARAELRKYLLAKTNGGQQNTFRSVFETFFQEFVRLFETTKHLTSTSKVTTLKSSVNTWLEASYGIISSEKRLGQVEHAKTGLSLADEWANVLHSEEIIRTTDL